MVISQLIYPTDLIIDICFQFGVFMSKKLLRKFTDKPLCAHMISYIEMELQGLKSKAKYLYREQSIEKVLSLQK